MIPSRKIDGYAMKRARPNEASESLDQQGMAAAGGAGAGSQISDGFPCVRLRGLPFDVMEGDIKMFLVGDLPALV